MGVANSRAVIFAGQGIDVISGLTVGMKDPYYGYLSHANAPNGVPVADNSGVIYARFIPMLGTPAQINLFVGAAGELASDGTVLRMFDGAQPGGFPVNLNSSACRYLGAIGTPLENGVAFNNAVIALHSMTPNGAAISATNPATLLLGPGEYDLKGNTGNTVLSKAGLRIIGIGGSRATKLTCDGTHCLVIYLENTWNPALSCLDHALVGLTFNSPSGGALRYDAQSLFDVMSRIMTIYHQDLDFPGLTVTASAMSWLQTNNGVGYTITGFVRNVRTTGRSLYGGWTTPSATSVTPAVTFTVGFENCYAGGDRSFGGSGVAITNRYGLITPNGYLYRCRMLGSADARWSCQLGAQMIDCEWNSQIERVASGCEIRNTIIRGVDVNGKSISNQGSSVPINVSYCTLAGGIAAEVTNRLTATPTTAANIIDVNA